MPPCIVPFRINVESPIAVYVQIENQVQFAVASGRLKPDDMLPSVRDMSQMLRINPNTVTKSYRDLELMGMVISRRGVGVSISDAAPVECARTAAPIALAHLHDAVAECVACGIDAGEVGRVVQETMEGAAA